jgi:hypothetical protein
MKKKEYVCFGEQCEKCVHCPKNSQEAGCDDHRHDFSSFTTEHIEADSPPTFVLPTSPVD